MYKKFICDFCNKTFRQNNNHNTRIHNFKHYISLVKNRKTLGDLCNFTYGEPPCLKYRDNMHTDEYVYPVVGVEKMPLMYHYEYNRDTNTIICSSEGKNAGFIRIYDSEIWITNFCFSIQSKDTNILDETYLLYYLTSIQEDIYRMQTNTELYVKQITPEILSSIEIPMYPIEKQNKIVTLYERFKETNDIKICKLHAEITELKDFEKEHINNLFHGN